MRRPTLVSPSDLLAPFAFSPAPGCARPSEPEAWPSPGRPCARRRASWPSKRRAPRPGLGRPRRALLHPGGARKGRRRTRGSWWQTPSDVPFWREYRGLGGPAELGFPLSARFVEGGNVYQALQAGILRRSAATELVDLHPVLLAMSELGLDEWLLQRGVPATAEALRDDPNLPLDTRLAWLTHPALRAVYLDGGEEEARRRFGLPMGEPVRFGPFLTQRFERGALQLWLDRVPGQPAPGTVTSVQVGVLLREAGLIPEPALAAVAPPAPRPVVQAPRPQVVPVVQGPGAPGGGKQVVVSLGRQWWWAYQNGEVVFNGPVTTGRPELATPAGRFTIFARFTPYTMYSPWPRGSPFWYSPSSMTYAMQITGNGVFLHDAPWRPYYGPGTNVWHTDPDGVQRTGSHGCINMPFGAAQFLWGWAPNGTQVLVS